MLEPEIIVLLVGIRNWEEETYIPDTEPYFRIYYDS